MEIYKTRSAIQTKKLGQRFAIKYLKSGGIVALSGDLGSGKTTFIQGIAKGLGIKHKIISPSFIIIRQYPIPKSQNIFYHIDLYRVDKNVDKSQLGLDEIFSNDSNVVVIEWADKLPGKLPKNVTHVNLSYIGLNQRRITITKNLLGRRSLALAQQFSCRSTLLSNSSWRGDNSIQVTKGCRR